MSELITDTSPSPAGVSDERSTKKSMPGALFRTLRTGAPVLPFLVYVTLGLLLPTVAIINLAFRSNAGKLTFNNLKVILCVSNSTTCSQYRVGFENSLKLALVTSIVPGILGVLGCARAVRRCQPGLHVHRQLWRPDGCGDSLAG